jgi:hypothetical protein
MWGVLEDIDMATTYILDHEEVLVELSRGVIRSSIETLRHEDRLTLALRQALREGADIDGLSDATGLTPAEIRRRVKRHLNVLSELELLAG